MFFSYIKSRRFFVFIFAAYMIGLVLNAFGFHVWLPGCPIYQYTGYECLGCGTNRALIDLLRFNFYDAWDHNPLVFVYLPAALLFITKDFYTYFLKFKHSKQFNDYGKI